jgi:hypothetical protein
VGQFLQLAAGLALIISGFADAGVSWGAYATAKGAEFTASAGVVYWIQHEAVNILKSKAIVPEVMSGPLGGNILAYGAREAANIEARASGGVAMSGTQTAVLDKQAEQQDQKQFRSESFFARVFDVHDYRSLASRAIDSSNPSMTQDAKDFASSLFGVRGILHNISSIFNPAAHAASQPYDWGFPQYGIPSTMASSPLFANPYDNADKVAALLDSSCLNSDGTTNVSCGYIKKANQCFGVAISKDNGVWNVAAEKSVIPTDGSYLDAHCADMSDMNWQRMMLFVFDTRTMDAIACDQGDDSSCANVGYGASASSTSSSSSPSDSSGYKNPLRDVKSLAPHRVDEGVDYAGTGPVYPLGNGKVLGLGANSDWPNHVFIVYQLTDGPANGKYVYMAEDCTPHVSVGQSVTADTVLCTMFNGNSGIETGWAAPPSSGTIALAHDVYQEGHSTAYGINFDKLMQKLGAPAGTYDYPGETPEGSLPSGWPSW